jgi:hypothetical protein
MDDRLTRSAGRVYCHAPADRLFDLAALESDGDGGEDRWDVPGERMAYLASTPAVAAAEWARHAEPDRADARQIVALELAPILAVDLRSRERLAAFGVAARADLLDRDVARRVAAAAHAVDGAGAILVPSAAFLDRDGDAFTIVLFCGRLSGGIAEALHDPQRVGVLTVEAVRAG